MTAGLVQHWLDSGRLELPLPAAGYTAERLQRLARLAQDDIAAARIAEAHVDAVAILHELGGKPPEASQLWGVWAAESVEAKLTATSISGDEFVLNGTKVWCSGAGFCSNALVTAHLEGGEQGLFAVTLTDVGVRPLPSTWWNPGMAGSDTRSVQFSNVHAILVGEPGDYPTRAGFWHGAIGVAACWLGGARRVADPLYRSARSESADAYALAHLGAVDAALAAGTRCWVGRRRISMPTRSTGPVTPSCWPGVFARSWNTPSTKRSPAPDGPSGPARCARTAGTPSGWPT